MQLKKVPDYSVLGLDNIMSYKGSTVQDAERAHAHDHVATLYNHVSGCGCGCAVVCRAWPGDCRDCYGM